MSLFSVHKPGQAKLSRTITLLSGLFLIAWGARSLLRTLPAFWPDLGSSWNELLLGATEAEAWRIDWVVVHEKFSPAFSAGLLVLLLGGFWWWRFLNRERWADLLIDMETELRKVSWPTLSDAWQSTLVVTGFTAAIVTTILVYDVVISNFLKLFVRTAV